MFLQLSNMFLQRMNDAFKIIDGCFINTTRICSALFHLLHTQNPLAVPDSHCVQLSRHFPTVNLVSLERSNTNTNNPTITMIVFSDRL